MVAATQGANGMVRPVQVNVFCASELAEIKRQRTILYGESAGDVFFNGVIQLVEIQVAAARLAAVALHAAHLAVPRPVWLDFSNSHAAADVHAHQVGGEFVGYGHSRTNYTAFAGVHIGHNPDFFLPVRFALCQILDLLQRGGLYVIGKNDNGISYAVFECVHAKQDTDFRDLLQTPTFMRCMIGLYCWLTAYYKNRTPGVRLLITGYMTGD